MSELTLTLLRFGYLAALWLMVLAIVLVLRRDIYGTQVTRRQSNTRTPRSPRGPGEIRGSTPPPPTPADLDRPRTPRSLVVTEGSLQGTTIALGQAPILIGRAPECTLVLDDDFASGRHARLSFHEGQWMVEDLGSTNGTFLGRARVDRPLPVEPGTPVRVGRTVLELRR